MIDYLVLCTVSIIFQPYNGKIILEHCELCFDYFDDTELYTGHVISEDREEKTRVGRQMERAAATSCVD